MTDDKDAKGPDLSKGIAARDLTEGQMLAGHHGDDEIVLVRHGGKVSVVSAHCTHYHGPLADGLLVGNTVRCPRHHACFDLNTGEALAAPALSPLTCWKAEERGGRIVIGEKVEPPAPQKTGPQPSASSLSAAVPRASQRPRCCGVAVTLAASPC